MTFRFLHSSDLHLGKTFGAFPEAIRNRLREARHGSISRLAWAARQGGAEVILLAGDTFDAETPAPETLRHALRAMAAEADIRWILLPGNHDSLAATELWRRIAADAPANLLPVTSPLPLPIAADIAILPAPCTQRRPGRDLTEAMSAPTPSGTRRIGLGHGAVTDFSGEDGASGIIPPDRASISGLDYLALGDWHGQMSIGPATWYSGTPEGDSFKHPGRGSALLVTLEAAARVEPVSTAHFDWQAISLDLLPGDDPVARLRDALPLPGLRRDTMLRVSASGRLPLSDRAALDQQADAIGPDFGWFEADFSALTTEAAPDDLERIDRAGALRQAAETLLAEAKDDRLPRADRDIASAALARLYALALEVEK